MRPLSIDANDRPVFGGHRRKPSRAKPRSSEGRSRRSKLASMNPWKRRGLYASLIVSGIASIGFGLNLILASELYAETVGAAEIKIARAMTVTGLMVNEINVRGRESTPPQDLLTAVGVGRGDPILFFDADAARRRIEQIAWVHSASVQRILPDTIVISIQERRPFARWQIDGRTVLVDRNGKVLSGGDPDAFRDLRRVVGPSAGPKARELFDMLALEPDLDRRVINAVRVRERRWDIEFDNGVMVQLPEQNPEVAWRHLAQIQNKKKVLDRSLVAIDMRLQDRTVVRLSPDVSDRLKEQEKASKKTNKAT